jgi:preprotein translocase subunit SecA
MRLFGSERIIGLVDRLGLPDDVPIDAKILSNQIENAQKRIEDQNFKRRKYVLSYDDVMNQQRTVIYKQRKEVLDGNDVSEKIRIMIHSTVSDTVAGFTTAEDSSEWNIAGIKNTYRGILCTDDDFVYEEKELEKLRREDITDVLIERADKVYAEKEALFGEARFREVERAVLLQCVDRSWMEHIEAMDDLKGSINLQAYAQRDPVTEYRMQGADMFDAMVEEIRERTVRMILSVVPQERATVRVEVAKETDAGFENGKAQKKNVQRAAVKDAPRREPVVKDAKVGRNDPCPCGSGKKYKKCCGAAIGASNE